MQQENKNLFDKAIIQQAAAWMVRMRDKPLSLKELELFDSWKSQSAAHEQAWLQAEAFTNQFKKIPSSIGMQVLDRPENPQRRQLIKSLGMFAVALPAGVVAYNVLPWQSWTADVSVPQGGHMSTVQLEDGGTIKVNVDTSLDIAYSAQARLIKLYQGDIYIETAKDNLNRPFLVDTQHGRLRALGTKFFVSKRESQSYLGVTEGAVEVALATDVAMIKKMVVPAGQQTWFGAEKISPQTVIEDLHIGWLDSVLYADNTPLKDVIASLSRYRTGVLRCDSTVANMPISGAFQLSQTDRVLEVLQQTRPIRVEWRTRYWGTIYQK